MPTLLEGETTQQTKTDRLLFYFGLMYFCQGFCQFTGLVNQPVRAYLKSLEYNARNPKPASSFAAGAFPAVFK